MIGRHTVGQSLTEDGNGNFVFQKQIFVAFVDRVCECKDFQFGSSLLSMY